MGLEIERKFLLVGDEWRTLATGSQYYCQGYLCAGKKRAVRVRISADKAFLTIKGSGNGVSRLEFDYPLPVEDAKTILGRIALTPLVEKIRHCVPYGALLWEVDEFLGPNKGLVLAEVELESEDQAIEKPPWAGVEVSADSRYYSAYLVKHPYRNWGKTTKARRRHAGHSDFAD